MKINIFSLDFNVLFVPYPIFRKTGTVVNTKRENPNKYYCFCISCIAEKIYRHIENNQIMAIKVYIVSYIDYHKAYDSVPHILG